MKVNFKISEMFFFAFPLVVLPMAAADAFITPSPLLAPTTKRTGAGGAPGPASSSTLTPNTVTAIAFRGDDQLRQRTIAPWSTSALEMSGGAGGGSGEAVSAEGTSTIPDEVFNLVKSIVGAGVLSLPAGE